MVTSVGKAIFRDHLGLRREPNADNRMHVVRRMRALGSTTEQIAAVMMVPVAAVLAIEKN